MGIGPPEGKPAYPYLSGDSLYVIQLSKIGQLFYYIQFFFIYESELIFVIKAHFLHVWSAYQAAQKNLPKLEASLVLYTVSQEN